MIVSTFEIEPVLSKAPSVSLSEPALEIDAVGRAEGGAERDGVRVRAADERLDVGHRCRICGEVPNVSLSLPSPRSIEAFESLTRDRDGVGTRAADQGLDVRNRTRVG